MRTLAALVGPLLAASAWSVALAALLPLSPSLRYAVGGYAVVPLWAAMVCTVFLARSARRAWLVSAALTALAVILAAVALRHGGAAP